MTGGVLVCTLASPQRSMLCSCLSCTLWPCSFCLACHFALCLKPADIDACATNPCGPSATCQDKPGSPGGAEGRNCLCGNGTVYAGDAQGCIDFDSCASDPCATDGNSTGTCVDKKAPLDGFSCQCKPGFEWSEKASACTGGLICLKWG
jgi:hypothetical protein